MATVFDKILDTTTGSKSYLIGTEKSSTIINKSARALIKFN